MTQPHIILLQISLSLFVFWTTWILIIRRIPHFGMQRVYLNTSLLLSVLIPFVAAGIEAPAALPDNWQLWINDTLNPATDTTESLPAATPAGPSFSWWWGLALVYLTGAAYRTFLVIREAISIMRLYRTARKERRDSITFLFGARIHSPFSFFHLVFLGKEMNKQETAYTICHEAAHVRGYHSWDNLLFELARVVLWFHPCVYLYKKYLNEVHEYLADREVVRQTDSRKLYAHFLLDNTGHSNEQSLVLGLSNKLITKRILMLCMPNPRPVTYLYMLILVPLTVLSFTACSMLEDETAVKEEIIEVPDLDAEYAQYEGMIINSVSWEGNTLYSDQVLGNAVGIEAGTPFSKTFINNRLSYSPTGEDISSLYMDNGYLFFHITPEVVPAGSGRVDLTFQIFEGEVVQVGTVCVTVEEGMSSPLTDYVDIHPGDTFSRAALISSSQKLTDATDGMVVNAIPNPYPGQGLVDIEFAISKKR